MFTRKAATPSSLDKAIESALSELNGHTADSSEYAQVVAQLTALNAIRDTKSDRVSKDTMAMILANLAGIIVIVGHERTHVVTSKALNFVGKFK